MRVPVLKTQLPAPLISRYLEARTLRHLQSCVREFESVAATLGPAPTRIRLAVTGNYSTQFLAKGFPLALAARDVHAEVHESPYNQWQFDLLDPASQLSAFAPTHVLLALSSVDLAFSALRTPSAVADAIIGAVGMALRNTEAHIVVTLPEPLADELSDWSPAYAWRQDVCDRLRRSLTSSRVTLVDIEPLIRAAGSAAWYDERFYDSSKLPFHPDRTPALLARLADAIVGLVAQRCKLVITDLDDTLWGGRVGDDGYQALELDPAGPGRHFLRMQSFLAGLQSHGVVLAIASKNDRPLVEEAFARRPEMMLRLEDFALAEIHWEPKSVSVGRILDRLNLTRTGIVFLDDNPVEREEVGRLFPELVIPELPADPAERVPMLLETGIFDRRVVTEESRARHQMYAQNEQREGAMAVAASMDDFLAGLEMVMEALPVDDARERVLELIQKTNQFNLTTRRHSWDQVRDITGRGFGMCYRLKDKFGDNGIISVVLVDADQDQVARIDLWLMSCRVLGRRVEEAILGDVTARARERGFRRLVGEYLPTAKNDLVRQLYPKLGFSEIETRPERSLYGLEIDAPAENPAPPPILVVERSAATG